MSKPILISIITPFFDSKKYFNKTFNSVLSQTYKNWEWIIVDDGSKKSESSFLNEIAKKDKRIRIISNKTRSGPAFSRNAAIRIAKGQFIAFLDSDDLWANNKLEKQLKFMLDNSYDFTATYYNVFDEKQGRISKVAKAPAKCTHKKLMRVNYVGCLTVMYKKSTFPDLQIPQEIAKRNDYAIWLKLSEHAPCYVLKECLATYVRHVNNSVSSISKIKMVKYHRDMFKILYGYSNLRATYCACRNALFFTLKELFYTSKIKGNQNSVIGNSEAKIEKCPVNIVDKTIKCKFDKKIYVGKKNIHVFKAILKESDLSSYTLFIKNEDVNLSNLLRVYVNVYNVGVFVFFVHDEGFNQELMSQQIRLLKGQKTKNILDAMNKTNELFKILSNFDYVFAVFKGEGERALTFDDFSKTNAKRLIVLEN